jgi:hypothetical protein
MIIHLIGYPLLPTKLTRAMDETDNQAASQTIAKILLTHLLCINTRGILGVEFSSLLRWLIAARNNILPQLTYHAARG